MNTPGACARPVAWYGAASGERTLFTPRGKMRELGTVTKQPSELSCRIVAALPPDHLSGIVIRLRPPYEAMFLGGGGGRPRDGKDTTSRGAQIWLFDFQGASLAAFLEDMHRLAQRLGTEAHIGIYSGEKCLTSWVLPGTCATCPGE